PAVPVASAAIGIFDRKGALYQSSRLQSGFGDHDDVEELGAVRRPPEWLGLIHRGDINHDDIRRVAQGVYGALHVAEPITEVRAYGVDDLTERFHTAQGVGINGMRIGATHVVLLLVSVTATSATSTGIGACGLGTVTSTHCTASEA